MPDGAHNMQGWFAGLLPAGLLALVAATYEFLAGSVRSKLGARP